MTFTVSAILAGQFKRLRIAILPVLAILALSACGTAAEPQPTTPPSATEAPAAATSEETTAAPSARLAPTFELPNAAGETISLSSYAGDKNVVLVFYRGFW